MATKKPAPTAKKADMLREVRKGITTARKSLKTAKTPARKAVLRAGITAMQKYYKSQCKKCKI